MIGRRHRRMSFVSFPTFLRIAFSFWIGSWAVLLAGESSPAPAGSIAGTVLDESRGVLPGATVVLRGPRMESPTSTITDDAGAFGFPDLPQGEYEVEAAFSGFNNSTPARISVVGGFQSSVELVLSVGGLVSSTSVEAQMEDSPNRGRLEPIMQPIETDPLFLRREQFEPKPFLKLRLSSDWYGLSSGDTFFSQMSSRLRMNYGSFPGEGWTWNFDGRHRVSLADPSRQRMILYDANLSYEDYRLPLFFSVGQMNLYENAGIGELFGAQFGYKLTSSFRIGAYGGLRPDFYGSGIDPSYRKYGFFAKYQGRKAESLSVSFNELRYAGTLERRFIYFTGLLPVNDRASLFGNLEYELGSLVRSDDRLSRVFLSGRFDVSRHIDVLASYSSGKGLDFHRYVIESSQDLPQNDAALERFYYNTQYGFRVRFKVGDQLRLHIGQRESTRKDTLIRNQTTQFGFAVSDLAKSGFSLYANYNLNRGDRSESDSVFASVSRAFGRISWTTSYSNQFNGLRYDQINEAPEIIHLQNRHTVSNEFFVTISRTFAVSVQHEHSFLGFQGEDLFFVRFLMRM